MAFRLNIALEISSPTQRNESNRKGLSTSKNISSHKHELFIRESLLYGFDLIEELPEIKLILNFSIF